MADFFTKQWVVENLPSIQPYLGFPYGGVAVVNNSLFKLSIVHATNTGVAWGFFANFKEILVGLRIALVGGILGVLFFARLSKVLQIALTCILAGAIGNIVDFFRYGHVIDMIYCIFYTYSYPIFNLADSAIFCSIVYILFHKRAKSKKYESSC